MERGHVARVVVADDEPVVRWSLRTGVESSGEFHVVAEAADGEEALEAVRAHLPDVLLLDTRMPRLNGVRTTAALHAEAAAEAGEGDVGAGAVAGPVGIIVMTALGLDAEVEQALVLGADGFLRKDASREELLAALRAVRDGDAVLPAEVLQRVLGAVPAPGAAARRQARDRLAELPPREAGLLALVARGLTNREIGERLGLDEETVAGRVGLLLAELGAANRLQLALLAHAAGPEGG
ncbi:response regulator transcription factor [Streptomyces sp. NPDC046866]|uniref:response regulator transcription factor n=1 Tax=Streptomyces sp. NPDC046866 TaxID=3154921 RepID=UPI003453C758